jgi:hypothetical protein
MKPNLSTLAAVVVSCFAISATPCLSGHEIPISANTEGGGRGTAQHYELTYTIGQASPVGIFSASAYDLSSGLMAMLSDITPPTIFHEPTQIVTAGMPVEIATEVADAKTGVDTVELFFRAGGSLTFREEPMQKGDGDTYLDTLPPSSVTERGLVYYIEARDHLGNVARYPQGAPDSLVNLNIYFSELTPIFEMPAGKYRMISLPGVPTNGSPDSIIVDDFGPYNKESWRLGRWNASTGTCQERCYDEYPSIDDFSPGRAFWLISSAARSFDFSGVSTDISRPFPVHLLKGWNQIGTPFGFTTDWLSAGILFDNETYSIGALHVVGEDTIYVEDDLIGYDGSYQPFQSQLQPWAGYWIYNSSTEEIDLVFDPMPTGSRAYASLGRGSASGANSLHLAGGTGTTDFLIALKVRSNEFPERLSLAGTSASASDSWDAFDLHEPPSIGDYLRAVFHKGEWGRHSGMYMSDIRRSSKDGAYWEFAVETSKHQHPSLYLEPAGEIPEGWRVFVYDIEAGIRLERISLPYSFNVEGSRKFALVAGTEDFIRTQEATVEIRLKPTIVSVVPNPFNQTVRVTFFVAEKTPVRLQIFSVEGRLVGTVADCEAARGIQIATWDGRSPQGQTAAPGVYFVRLEAGRTVLTQKILKVK